MKDCKGEATTTAYKTAIRMGIYLSVRHVYASARKFGLSGASTQVHLHSNKAISGPPF